MAVSNQFLNSTAPASMQKQAQLDAILQNWNLSPSPASRSAILPPSISSDCLNLSESLLPAIHQLSGLTVGRRERAHSLLNTYFQERIRQGSYSGRNKNIYATLELQDVERAIQSAERMKAGHAMQLCSNDATAEPQTIGRVKKRKYEGLEEIARFNESCRLEDTRPTKFQRPNEGDDREETKSKTLHVFTTFPPPPCSQSPTPPTLSLPKPTSTLR